MANSILIHGRLVRDPETRQTANGKSVCNFTVAVDRKFTPQGQEKQSDFFDVVAWGGGADVVAKYFSKGSEIVVSGRMEQRKWQDKEGNNRYSWEIQMQDFDFCGSKSDKATAPTAPAQDLNGFTEVDIEKDDLPF